MHEAYREANYIDFKKNLYSDNEIQNQSLLRDNLKSLNGSKK